MVATHGNFHVNLGAETPRVEFCCSHDEGCCSWRISDSRQALFSVYLTGTPQELKSFACELLDLAQAQELEQTTVEMYETPFVAESVCCGV